MRIPSPIKSNYDFVSRIVRIREDAEEQAELLSNPTKRNLIVASCLKEDTDALIKQISEFTFTKDSNAEEKLQYIFNKSKEIGTLLPLKTEQETKAFYERRCKLDDFCNCFVAPLQNKEEGYTVSFFNGGYLKFEELEEQ